MAPNTSGKKIPSHATNQFGTRYAYDFLQVDWKKRTAHLSDSLAIVSPFRFICCLKSAHAFNPRKDDSQFVSATYIIMICNNDVYAGLVHLQIGSIRVSVGQSVKKGEGLGKVGHSVNSFFGHLHFQLMDRSDILSAKGLHCVFEPYE